MTDQLQDLAEGLPPSNIGEGWFPIVLTLHMHLIQLNHNYAIVMIRQEEGALVFDYSTNKNEYEMDLLAQMAVTSCSNTCEQCGMLGSVRTDLDDIGEKVRSLCDDHYNDVVVAARYK